MILFNYVYRSADHFRYSFTLARYGHTNTIYATAILIIVLMLGRMNNTLASETMELSENDSGKTVEINVGDELEIVVPGNPTTGYVWEVRSHDSNILRLINSIFSADDKAIGAGGMEIIKFHAIAEGKSRVTLIFHRPFEHNIPPLKTFDATIVIKK